MKGATLGPPRNGSARCDFNPRSREGSDLPRVALYLTKCDFNPRSREGSDLVLKDMVNLTDDISIHAPVKGATTARGTGIKTQHDFNPRSREGSDFLPKGSRNNVLNISIHAPVKGATPCVFNSVSSV